jgi:hypothetical protein
MRSARHLLLTIVLALAGLVLACTDANSPTSQSNSSTSFSTANQELTKAEWQQRHEELKERLRAQKQRIKEQREQRKADFELARAEWNAYRREWKRINRGKSAKLVDLLRCEPRPYDGEAAIIGPDGGTLHIGEHQLVIPRGALPQEELIVAEAPTSSLVDVEFSPEGLTFTRPAELTLSYKGCDVPTTIDLLLAYVGWGNRILELPPSHDQRDLSEVIGEIDHFSRYAVAY